MSGSGSSQAVRRVSASEAEALVRDGAVRVVDVRTAAEFESLGHIPGALLLPLDLLAVAPATLSGGNRPLLVCCEHGIRSAHAAHFLARAGLAPILDLAGGMSCWSGPRRHDPGSPYTAIGPSSWLVENGDLLPRQERALDVACGTGRHALLLASAGLTVRGVDRDADRLKVLQTAAERLALPIEAERIDLEAGDVGLGVGIYDLVVVFHYLHRALFPALLAALKPGGLLLYETFTVDQAERGGPTTPAFLLELGELPRLVRPLEILRQRQGEYDGRMVAAVAARRSP